MRVGLRWLLGALVVVCVWCGWLYLRPYDAKQDVAAPWQMIQVTTKRDHRFYWVRCELRVKEGQPLAQSILLHTDLRRIRSADCLRDGGVDRISFWVEEGDLQGGCRLELNGKSYLVKKAGVFSLADGEGKTFRQPDWM